MECDYIDIKLPGKREEQEEEKYAYATYFSAKYQYICNNKMSVFTAENKGTKLTEGENSINYQQ